MKTIPGIILFIFLCSCGSHNQDSQKIKKNQASSDFDSTQLCGEKRMINEGDSLMLIGGKNKLIKKLIGSDTCKVKAKWISFSAATSEIALIDFYPIKNEKFHCVTLYYWDSKRGYSKSRLMEYDEDPKRKEDSDGLSCPNNRILDEEIILRKIIKTQ